MGCVSKVFITIGFILGLAGTVMGIISLWKIYDDTGDTPWCDTCKEMFKDSPETCKFICNYDPDDFD